MKFLKSMFSELNIYKNFFEDILKHQDEPELIQCIIDDGVDINEDLFSDLITTYKKLNDPKAKTRNYLILKSLNKQ